MLKELPLAYTVLNGKQVVILICGEVGGANGNILSGENRTIGDDHKKVNKCYIKSTMCQELWATLKLMSKW